MGTLKRRSDLLDAMPDVACTGACAAHACRDLTVSELDVVAVRVATGLELTTAADGRHCSLLSDEGRCVAHEQRPFICRVFGTHSALPCPHGCQPVDMLTTAQAVNTLVQLEQLDPRAARYLRIGAEPDSEVTARLLHDLT